MSYAEIVLATVPAALPTEKNQRATSWPPPISANVPYARASRLSASAFCRVVGVEASMPAARILLPERRRALVAHEEIVHVVGVILLRREDALEQHPGRQHRERWRTVDYTKLPGGF